MKKLNQLVALVLFVFIAFLTSCEKETTIEEQASANATDVASIKEAKEAFFKQNKSINLLTGKPENLQAKGSSTSNYFIDWKNSKKVKFKKGVDILSTPVVRKFVDKRESSFIASFKNGDKIEHRFFMIYHKKGVDNSKSFSGYLLKFKINAELEALYRYKEGVLEVIYAPKKSKLQHRLGGSCNAEAIYHSLKEGDDDDDDDDVTHLGCVVVVAKLKQTSLSIGSGGGFSFWHNPSHYIDDLLSNTAIRNHHSNDTGLGDVGDSNNNNKSKDEIINNLKSNSKANCVYGKLEDNSILKKTLSKFNGKDTPVHLMLVEQKNLRNKKGKLLYGETDYGKSYIIKITLNTDLANSRPSLAVARTILHEAIHAEIYRKIKTTAGLHETIENRKKVYKLNGKRADFPTLFDYYNKYPKNPQHNYMADYYRKAIELGLREYAKHIGESYPEQLYKDLAWKGLEGTNAWKKMYKNSAKTKKEQDRITKSIENFNKSGKNECN